MKKYTDTQKDFYFFVKCNYRLEGTKWKSDLQIV